jgi:fructuronate reductase
MNSALPRLHREGTAPETGIVHLGLGAFFRSHGAIVVEEVMDASEQAWGIMGVSLQSPSTRDRLAPQGNLYTAVEMGSSTQEVRIVKVLSGVMFAPEDPESLVARLADPAVKIVSLTVTEKGYCHVPSTGELDLLHPDIQHDIKNIIPRSALGYLVRALMARRTAGYRPFTVLSCDNLPDNGRLVRNVVIGLANEIDPSLAQWIAAEGRFPSTMVDRIVPSTTPQDIEKLSKDTGLRDEAPVFHEPFLQWVIEDDFVDGQRPRFEDVAGVQMVKEVAPFEHMKIRMLNGTHSSLAYLGYLAGYETIAETVNDPVFRAYVRKLWEQEIIPTLIAPEGVDLQSYANDLLDRYSNPSIRHRTWQIAMDGSQKLPQRILGTIADNLKSGRSSDLLILAVAAWMRYVGGVDERGNPIEVKDPMALKLRALSDAETLPSKKVANLLSVDQIFSRDLADQLQKKVTAAYAELVQHGARAKLIGMEGG